MIALSPIFAWGAKQVGYAEPLDNAAEITGATTEAVTLLPGVLPGYTVPGIGPYLGTLIAGGIGTMLTLGIAVALGYLLRTDN
jgi:cobalt/nickel transport protein